MSQGKMCNSVRRWLSTKPTVVMILQHIQISFHHIVYLKTYTVFCVNYISEKLGEKRGRSGGHDSARKRHKSARELAT